MSDCIIGQIDFFSFSEIPNTHLPCQGGAVLISKYKNLFDVIGIAFGGDGKTSFNLPDLRNKATINMGKCSSVIGKKWDFTQEEGSEVESLDITHCPTHTHFLRQPLTAPTSVKPEGSFGGFSKPIFYCTATSTEAGIINSSFIYDKGQSIPHENMQPFLVLHACICFSGLKPEFTT